MQKGQKTEKIALEPGEVGGELLDILSRGLYSDAKDTIREYIQNGIDAGASTVMVSVSGPVAVIRDDGTGMNWDTLRRARRFGVSEKSPRLHVGYRGIGLYASFAICESLLISTRQVGMDELLHLRFHFGHMRRILEQDRVAEKRVGIALADLLYEYTEFSREVYSGDPQDHFTVVRLEGLNQEYRAQLTGANALNSYLLNTIPIAFPDNSYGPTVNTWLREHVGLNPIRVVLRIGNEPEFEVEPPLAEGVEPPQYHHLVDAKGRHLAFVWHSLSTKGERITSLNGADEGSGISGFLLKMKGFTLGDRTRLKPLWPPVGGRTLYHHYTGEVHILENANVYPNAARDDLEPSPEKQALFRHIEDYSTDLNRRADLTRDIIKTQRRMQGIRETIDSLMAKHPDLDADPYEVYRESKNFLESLQTIERELLRLRRGRKAVIPTPAQKSQLDNLVAKLHEAKQVVSTIVQSTARHTERGVPPSGVAIQREQPPQTALLAKAVDALQAMCRDSPTQELTTAFDGLSSAAKLHMAARAVAILDGLKALGIRLSDRVETSRKELRTFLGWSPIAPVSLEEALTEEGFSPATDREQALIRSVDRGLLNGLGGRGERYEGVLRSVAEEVAQEDELR